MPSRQALHLPIWRDAQKLLVWTEKVVRGFAKFQKYIVGPQLREQAMRICRLAP